MNVFKTHIASLLLLGFLFPQVANAVHHFLIPHKTSVEEQSEPSYTVPAYDYHSCDYHLSGIKFVIPESVYREKKLIPEKRQEDIPTAFLLHTQKIAFNFSVRGSPEERTF